MKLSEMRTQDAFEAMVKMLPHVSAILEDAEIAAEKAKIKSKAASGAQTFGAVIPLVLGKHAEDMFAIVAHATANDVQAVRDMPVQEMREAFDEAWKDVLGFFPLCLRLVANA